MEGETSAQAAKAPSRAASTATPVAHRGLRIVAGASARSDDQDVAAGQEAGREGRGVPELRRRRLPPAPGPCRPGMREVTRCMHVHANTVRYRLRRSEELTGMILDAADTVVELGRAMAAGELRTPPQVRRRPRHERAGRPP
ncbi:helix-turn-helix domain-containing protein [Streptomyces massasporeus]|uniref:helix-turn-helix domain-containing protein n=1 Tax=Streptomyces massasporeus TaxID=67324 RepID=UPI0033C73D85